MIRGGVDAGARLIRRGVDAKARLIGGGEEDMPLRGRGPEWRMRRGGRDGRSGVVRCRYDDAISDGRRGHEGKRE